MGEGSPVGRPPGSDPDSLSLDGTTRLSGLDPTVDGGEGRRSDLSPMSGFPPVYWCRPSVVGSGQRSGRNCDLVVNLEVLGWGTDPGRVGPVTCRGKTFSSDSSDDPMVSRLRSVSSEVSPQTTLPSPSSSFLPEFPLQQLEDSV